VTLKWSDTIYACTNSLTVCSQNRIGICDIVYETNELLIMQFLRALLSHITPFGYGLGIGYYGLFHNTTLVLLQTQISY